VKKGAWWLRSRLTDNQAAAAESHYYSDKGKQSI